MEKEKAEKIVRIYNWIRAILIVVIFALIIYGSVNAQTTNDFGAWTTVSTEKKIGERWNINANMEVRTKGNCKNFDRWQLGVNGAYKVSPILKLAVGQEFHLKKQTIDDVSEVLPRYRLMVDATLGIKLWNILKLSLRERYQYTYTMHKAMFNAYAEHHLRSRIKTEIVKNNCAWNPYASVEVFNNFCEKFQVDELRIAIGTAYNISHRNTAKFGYLLDLKGFDSGNNKALHVITLEYVYKF